jgi:hypothetical protein
MAELTFSTSRCIRIATLPLAVYREVAAHLEQVQGVHTSLIWDADPKFDYSRSQIQGLTIQIETPEPTAEVRIQSILQHYSDRFGTWETLDDESAQ